MQRLNTSQKAVDTNTANINRALTDPMRINIVEALWRGDMSLKELGEFFDVNEQLMQYHVRLLMRIGVIGEYKYGGQKVYTVAQPTVAQACHILYTMWAKEVARPNSHARLAWS